MNSSNLQLMRSLRLTGMADHYEAIHNLPTQQHPTSEILLSQLLDAENFYRLNRRTTNAIHNAKFKYQANLKDIICTASRNITNELISKLADCSFIEKGENVIITGATGCGKSYLASALGYQACNIGYKVMYYSLPKLLSKIKLQKFDGSITKEIDKLESKNLLILDDWGLTPLETHTRLILLQIIEDRHQKYSTIITSQLPINAWHEYINDNTVADAILDRIIHKSIRIELKGDSLRKPTK